MRRPFPDRALLVPAVLLCVGAALAAQAASPPTSQVTGPRGTVTTPAAATGTAALRGLVVASDTGTPLRRAVVRATSSEPPDNGTATTDDQGRFEIGNLVGGRYYLNVSKTGFVNVAFGQRRPGERGTPVEVAPGQTVEKITIGLPRGGVIAGRVMDEVGEPLADARVQVLRHQFVPGGRRMVATGRGDSTDDQGGFRIFGLTPGDYVVSATARGETTFIGGPNDRPVQGATADQGYAPTYYPGTPSQADAQRITVGVGQEVSGVTFGMTPTRVSRVSGRVVGGKAEDVENSFVMVMNDDGAGMTMSAGGGMVQRDGTFRVNGLAPGRYTLRVQPRTGPGADSLVGATSLTVTGVDLDNVVISMRRPGDVTGRVEFEGGAPASVAARQVRVMPVSTDPMNRSFAPLTFRTNDDLTFLIRGAVGPTLLRVNGAPGWYVKSIEAGGDDITDTPITLALGTDVRDVRILLTQAVAALAGAVRDARGNAVLDATVVLFPSDETKWTFSSRFIRTARPGTDGRFEIRGLPPSSGYRVIALQGLEDMQAFDPEFLASIRDRAEGLTLAAGDAKTMDVKLR